MIQVLGRKIHGSMDEELKLQSKTGLTSNSPTVTACIKPKETALARGKSK